MFQLVLIWFSAMAWHLWRIITMRPAFKHLSDTGPMAMSFIGIYYAAGILRWVVLNDDPKAALMKTVLGLFLWMVVIFACFERRSRSSALTASVLGVSAAIDFLVCAGVLFHLLDSVHTGLWGSVLEFVWTGIMMIRFLREPEYVQRVGYRMSDARQYAQAN